jgi:hypothetical protein
LAAIASIAPPAAAPASAPAEPQLKALRLEPLLRDRDEVERVFVRVAMGLSSLF